MEREGKTVCLPTAATTFLHPGHIRLLEAAHRWADVLILALNTDASVQRMKGPSRPFLIEMNVPARRYGA